MRTTLPVPVFSNGYDYVATTYIPSSNPIYLLFTKAFTEHHLPFLSLSFQRSIPNAIPDPSHPTPNSPPTHKSIVHPLRPLHHPFPTPPLRGSNISASLLPAASTMDVRPIAHELHVQQILNPFVEFGSETSNHAEPWGREG